MEIKHLHAMDKQLFPNIFLLTQSHIMNKNTYKFWDSKRSGHKGEYFCTYTHRWGCFCHHLLCFEMRIKRWKRKKSSHLSWLTWISRNKWTVTETPTLMSEVKNPLSTYSANFGVSLVQFKSFLFSYFNHSNGKASNVHKTTGLLQMIRNNPLCSFKNCMWT
jgi:hypothetical protein